MKMRFKKYAPLLVVAATVAAGTFTVHADVTTPYSMYGYGVLGDRAPSMLRQMGGGAGRGARRSSRPAAALTM